MHKSYESEEYSWDQEKYRMSYYLKEELSKGKQSKLNNYNVLNDGWGWTNLNLYIKMLKAKGVNISSKDFTKLIPGDSVITGDGQVKNYLANHYSYNVIEDHNDITRYEILGFK